jgi:SAM-dependent methyltransferase
MNIPFTDEKDIICPVCENNRSIYVGKPKISLQALNFIRKDYSVEQCINCGYYFIYPDIDITEDEWKQLYNSAYFARMTGWHEKQRITDIKNRFYNLQQFYGNGIENFLDLGCGEGLGLLEANNMGWNAYGIDIADNRTEDAKNNNINFIRGDIFSANLPGEYFDSVYMDSVLEHLIDPVSYLRELNRIMKKGGTLYIGVPNEDSLFNDVKKIFYRLTGNPVSEKIKPFDSPYHVGGFNKTSLPAAVSKTNFKIIEINNFAARFEFRKYPVNSKNFWLHLFMLPVDLLAILIRKEIYLEVYLKK